MPLFSEEIQENIRKEAPKWLWAAVFVVLALAFSVLVGVVVHLTYTNVPFMWDGKRIGFLVGAKTDVPEFELQLKDVVATLSRLEKALPEHTHKPSIPAEFEALIGQFSEQLTELKMEYGKHGHKQSNSMCPPDSKNICDQKVTIHGRESTREDYKKIAKMIEDKGGIVTGHKVRQNDDLQLSPRVVYYEGNSGLAEAGRAIEKLLAEEGSGEATPRSLGGDEIEIDVGGEIWNAKQN